MSELVLDWNHYTSVARQIAADGCVLLENNNAVLPFARGTRLAVFGRSQMHYYKSGIGSGGLVNVDSVTGILEGLAESGAVSVDETLAAVYRDWTAVHPYVEGIGWGQEPWSQTEMVVASDVAAAAAARTDCAVVIIGRCAGEDKDNKQEPGSFLLSAEESDMLKTVRAVFKKMVVVLNVGNIIDMSFVRTVRPDAVVYAWQGGMTGGSGLADILTGAVNPSGKLTDTIAYSLEDYPSHTNFGDSVRNIYTEDIFVGYRYFETIARHKVMYPFGYGLSYTTFAVSAGDLSCACDGVSPAVSFPVSVTNTGAAAGREVVQVYMQIPQGRLGKPLRTLCAFNKTKLLAPGESQTLIFTVKLSDFASFDDTGCTGHKNCMILEDGVYTFFAGSDVRSAAPVGEYRLDSAIVTEQLDEALQPVVPITRLKAVSSGSSVTLVTEHIEPAGFVQLSHRNEALASVQKKYAPESVASLEPYTAEVLSKLSDHDLVCIIRGEGMGSPKVTPGTAGAFGGVTPSLKAAGIPCGCCTDGPSGLRLDSGAHAFSLPIGTMQACTFDPPLIKELYYCTGLEMVSLNVDILLAPGINIHRYPLNGRNFEYFSEDPYVTGLFAAAIIDGLHDAGVSGSLKHFCGNNQEWNRSRIDTVASCRALREIYLKCFEIPVKRSHADVVMTSYGSVNGMWTAGSYDLNTRILRDEWGFKGIVMSDWWAVANEEGKAPFFGNFAAMVRAQNDLFMVCSDSETNPAGDNLEQSLADGTLDRAELMRSADNIVSFLAKSRAQARSAECSSRELKHRFPDVRVINRPVSAEDAAAGDVVYYPLSDHLVVPLDSVDCKKGNAFTFALDCSKIPGLYTVVVTGKTDSGDLAQIPVTIAANGIHVATLTWNGTGGAWQTIERTLPIRTRYTVLKMYFAQGGLSLRDAEFTYIKEADGFAD